MNYTVGIDSWKLCTFFNTSTSGISISVALFSSFAFVAIYFIFYWKPNILRDLSEIGFDYLKDGSYRTAEYSRRSKISLVQSVQRRRALGDLPPIYPNGWFVLLESCELRKGEVKHVNALGENFAVFRSESGKVHVLDAYCPHLGANMAIGGSVHGDCLECPFHKWRFSGDTGACTSVSYSSSCPSSARVKTWKSVEANDFIFVWYHAENNEPDWHIEQRSVLKSKGWSFQGRSDCIVGCHIQEIPENGADIGHLDALHGASLLGGSDLRHCEQNPYQFLKHIWTANWEASEKEPHKGLLNLNCQTRIFQKYTLNYMKGSVQQIGPGYVELLFQTSWGSMYLLQAVTPIEPLQQRVIHRIYSPFSMSIFAKICLYIETIMFQRDVMVWNHKKYQSKPVLVKEDRSIVRHRRWYHQFYSENSPRFQFQKDTLEW